MYSGSSHTLSSRELARNQAKLSLFTPHELASHSRLANCPLLLFLYFYCLHFGCERSMNSKRIHETVTPRMYENRNTEMMATVNSKLEERKLLAEEEQIQLCLISD